MKRSYQIRRFLPAALLPVFYALLTSGSASAIVAPRQGGELPAGFREARDKDAGAFLPRRGWIGRSAAVRNEAAAALTAGTSSGTALSGTMRVPVIAGLYSNYAGSELQDLSLLRIELFEGPWNTGTMSGYFREASRGLFDVTGDVFGWVDLTGNEDYYVQPPSAGLSVGVSRTGEFIEEAVAGADPGVDFGLYDNDGPDGIPNSGDDDGYVDVLILVHPAMGAECANNLFHMWSHSYQYSLWDGVPGGPLQTDDPSANGGMILVDDYIMAPTVSCDGGLIEIGVFCHEMGHSIGLPDLYDEYGSNGIGYWGLMGSGNWNTPESPAHPCGWSKEQLGWVDAIDIGWVPEERELLPVIQSGEVLRLDTPVRRFRRAVPPSAGSGWALVCGYTEEEALHRRWPGGAGYGNDWDQSFSREFTFDGNGPVTLGYDIETDLEDYYDFVYVLLEHRDGSPVDTLAVYTGRNGMAPETADLSPLLDYPGPDSVYSITFRMVTDFSYSDEDGRFDSDPGRALLLDNISVTGGGEAYFTDFEQDAGGWRDVSPASEYFLVENRTRTGFDRNLPGQGLLIWHAENSTANSTLGNSGGSSNQQTRGLVLEEADGRYDLLNGTNMGDQGDPWPGTSGNTDFASGTWPSSSDNNGRPTPVSITGISGASALCKAGMPPPEVASASPPAVDKADGDTFQIDVRGTGFLFGAGCSLSRQGQTVQAAGVEWLGETRVLASFLSVGLFSGEWDVTLISGDGQAGTLEGGLTVSSRIVSAGVDSGLEYITPYWSVSPLEGLVGSLLYRAEAGGPFVLMGDTIRSGTGAFEFQDTAVIPGTLYRYRLRVVYESAYEDFQFSGEFSTVEHDFEVIASDVERGLYYLKPVWLVKPLERLEGSLLYRSADGGPFEQVGDTLRSGTGGFEYFDDSVEPGVVYRYMAKVIYDYTEDAFDFPGTYSIEDRGFHVTGQHPNPFSESTAITFFTPDRRTVGIRFFDVAGRLVDELGPETFSRGTHEVVWTPRAEKVASGVYFCAVTTRDGMTTLKVVLIR